MPGSPSNQKIWEGPILSQRTRWNGGTSGCEDLEGGPPIRYAQAAVHELHPNPTYVNSSDQVCDQVIICGDTAVFIETKLATCTAMDRYSGDYEKIKSYLEDKLVTKGVNQLFNAVTRCAAKGADVPDYLKGINEIIPVIITRDDFGGCWGVNAYLNKRFKDR